LPFLVWDTDQRGETKPSVTQENGKYGTTTGRLNSLTANNAERDEQRIPTPYHRKISKKSVSNNENT